MLIFVYKYVEHKEISINLIETLKNLLTSALTTAPQCALNATKWQRKQVDECRRSRSAPTAPAALKQLNNETSQRRVLKSEKKNT